jgi:hypothetical protein
MSIRLSDVRPTLLGGILLASVTPFAPGCASAWRCESCSSPSELGVLDTVQKPFEGAAYSFGPQEGYAAYFPGTPDSARKSLVIPYVPNYYGPFPRAAQDLRRPFYQPGPYFYTPTPPYARSYYGYYDTPSYFRY